MYSSRRHLRITDPETELANQNRGHGGFRSKGSQTARVLERFRRERQHYLQQQSLRWNRYAAKTPRIAASKTTSCDHAVSSRGYHLLSITPQNSMREVARYMSPKMRKIVYSKQYWSCPLRTKSQIELDNASTQALMDKKVTPIDDICAQALAELAPRNKAKAKARGFIARNEKKKKEAPKLDIMALLDHTLLHKIEREFTARGDNLDLEAFVEMMTTYLRTDGIDDVSLASNLCQFFSDVDVNGDGTMDWSEFTNAIIDRGMNQVQSSAAHSAVEQYRCSKIRDVTPYSNMLEKALYFDELDHLVVLESTNPWFWVLDGKDLSPIARSLDGTDPDVKANVGHYSELINAEYIPDFKWLATCSHDRTIRFWDPQEGYAPLPHVISSERTQMVMRWLPEQQSLLTATQLPLKHNSKKPVFHPIKSRNRKSARKKREKRDQFEINFDDPGVIETWKFDRNTKVNRESFTPVRTDSFEAHSKVILDMLVLQNMGVLASASMDRTIALWDLTTHQRQHELTGQHEHGVFQLAYHSNYHALISAGFEHNAVVWNPYCAKKICVLKHPSPLIGIQAVPDSPQILTADCDGIIKVWDIRNFGCIQTLHVEDEQDTRIQGLTSFSIVNHHKRLVTSADRLYIQESLTSFQHHSPHVADLEPTTRVVYNSHTATFITASGTTIKIWNAVDGTLQRVYRNIVPDPISSLCLDSAHKKFVLGDVAGNIHIFNYLNGARLKTVNTQQASDNDSKRPTPSSLSSSSWRPMQKSRFIDRSRKGRRKGRGGALAAAASKLNKKTEITAVFYIRELRLLLSACWDSCLRLYDDNTDDEVLPLIKKLRHHREEISCAAFSENLSLFASGSADGHIYLWDFRSQVLCGELLGHRVEITALEFLDPYPLIVSADSEGNICFWLVRPMILNVSKCILRMINYAKKSSDEDSDTEEKTAKKIPCPVTSLTFWHTEEFSDLYAGDVNGVIRCWSIRSALRKGWGLAPFHSDDSLDRVSEKSFKKNTQTIASRFNDYISYRHLKSSRSLVHKLTENARRGINRNTLLFSADIQLKRWWQAHTDMIRDLNLVKDPEPRALVSAGFDNKVCLWDMNGHSLGNLQQGRTAARQDLLPEWRFKADVEGMKRRAQNHARQVLAQLQAKKDREKAALRALEAAEAKLAARRGSKNHSSTKFYQTHSKRTGSQDSDLSASNFDDLDLNIDLDESDDNDSKSNREPAPEAKERGKARGRGDRLRLLSDSATSALGNFHLINPQVFITEGNY